MVVRLVRTFKGMAGLIDSLVTNHVHTLPFRLTLLNLKVATLGRIIIQFCQRFSLALLPVKAIALALFLVYKHLRFRGPFDFVIFQCVIEETLQFFWGWHKISFGARL